MNRVVMKGPNAWIEVPELEFEIAASGKRVIDTVYNHVAGAIFELTRHTAFVCGLLLFLLCGVPCECFVVFVLTRHTAFVCGFSLSSLGRSLRVFCRV